MTLRETIAALVEAVVGPRIDLARTYLARVDAQHADGTLDLIPDSTRIPSLTRVPVYYGVPGVSAKVAKGARVVLGFAGGDASLPYAMVWETASVTEVTIDADRIRLGGDRNVAREGDPVVVLITPTIAKDIPTLATGALAVSGYVLRGSSQVTAP